MAAMKRDIPYFRWLIVALLAAMGVACGGGGGGGGESPPPTPTGPGDAEKFFPDNVGDTWFFESIATENLIPGVEERGFRQLAVTGTKSVGGAPAKVFASTDPADPTASIETYYSKDSNGVTNRGNNDPTDVMTKAAVPYLEGKFPVALGTITDLSRSNVEWDEDLDGDGRKERVDFRLLITMDGFEPLEVPAGSFSRTAKRTAKIDGTLRTTSAGNFAFTATEQLWSAPGAGVMKQAFSFAAGGETLDEVLVARGYKVDGVGHGMGLPRVLLGGLLPADSSPYPPGPQAVASDGANFMLSTVRQTEIPSNPPVTKVVAAFGDADGNLVREVDVTSPAMTTNGGMPLAAAWDGSNYLLVYSAGSLNTPIPLLATRISPAGVLLDGQAGFEIDEGTVFFAAVAWGSSHYLVVFSRFDNSLGQHQLFGRLVTPAGNVVGATEFPIGRRDRTQLYPHVDFDGTNFLVAWQESLASGIAPEDTGIVAARVTEAGVVLDLEGFAVAQTGQGSYQPRVAFGGGQYLVVWEDPRNAMDPGYYQADIYAARVSTAGVLLDGPPSSGGLRVSGAISVTPRQADVVFAGSEFLVAWAAGSYSGVEPLSGIFAARISGSGTRKPATGYGLQVSGPPSMESFSTYHFPRAARLGSRLVVTWFDNSELSGGLKGMRVVPVYSLE
jgi:hypothetical protein